MVYPSFIDFCVNLKIVRARGVEDLLERIRVAVGRDLNQIAQHDSHVAIDSFAVQIRINIIGLMGFSVSTH